MHMSGMVRSIQNFHQTALNDLVCLFSDTNQKLVAVVPQKKLNKYFLKQLTNGTTMVGTTSGTGGGCLVVPRL